MNSTKIFNNRYLLFILILALLVRIYISFGTGLAWISTDSANYINQANALLRGEYIYYFPNGYPLIISLLILISSIVPLHIGLILLNILLSTLSVILIYLISKKYVSDDESLPLIIAAIAAFYPNQLNYVRLILTEVPATFFLILSLYLFIRNKKISSGIILGFASAIRTTLLPISFLFAVYLVFKKKYKEGLTFLFFSLVPLMIFLIYGYVKTGNFTLFIDIPKIFYISLGLEKVPPDFISGLNSYFSYMFTHPLNFIYDRIISLWDMWGFLPGTTEGLRSGIFFRILIALRFPLLLLAIYGFIKTRENYISVYLFLPAVVITLIHALIITSSHESYIANPRYIFPTEPFLIVLTVIGISKLFHIKKVEVNIKSLNN